MFNKHFRTCVARIIEWTCGIQAFAWLFGVFDELTAWVVAHTEVALLAVAANAIYSLVAYDLEVHRKQIEFEKARKVRRRARR